MAFPKVCNKAPAFSLKDQNGDTVKLADFKGKKNVLLYFYPKAKTPGCTVQACGIRDTYAEFGKRMRGTGPYAWMVGRRFELASKRLGLNRRKLKLNTELFTPPNSGAVQLDLF